jgi:hypothetical protein
LSFTLFGPVRDQADMTAEELKAEYDAYWAWYARYERGDYPPPPPVCYLFPPQVPIYSKKPCGRGWTAAEIVRDVARRFGIKL